MRAVAIVLRENPISERGYANLVKSSRKVGNEFDIERFDAIHPEESNDFLAKENLKWTWPWDQARHDLKTGLYLTPYPTRNRAARIACFCSHYSLWKEARKEPLLILEHDALFLRKFDLAINKTRIIGITDPRGATRRANLYHQILQENTPEIQHVPRVDKSTIPQGLPGNSAYVITPQAAEEIMKGVKSFGAWPNDALMCYQIFPFLRVTRTYYTRVQGLRSTTSL